ncbi:MAG: alanyl-tRNA editing protein AlaXM [Candidatus Bathyarchaeia archaeon]|nr:alanyl-tRNA editing protein [Candidatus Bathyarchaeota archaeon]
MTKALYLEDSYLKECEARVLKVIDGRKVVLDQTIFYPGGGGQPHDTGKLVRGNDTFNVTFVTKVGSEIIHEVDRDGLQIEDRVRCIINWDRRYRLMRSHTAAHVFASLVCNETGALVTGNQIEEDKVRFDFSLERLDREMIVKCIEKANDLFRKDIEVRWYELPREEALKIPGVVKMARAFPPDIPMLRIVEVVGVDIQADGGTHVRNLREVGQIRLLKFESKGRMNKRVYFAIEP